MSFGWQHTDVNFHPFPKMSRIDEKVSRTRVFRSLPGLTDCLLRSEVWNHLKSTCLIGTSFPQLRRNCSALSTMLFSRNWF